MSVQLIMIFGYPDEEAEELKKKIEAVIDGMEDKYFLETWVIPKKSDMIIPHLRIFITEEEWFNIFKETLRAAGIGTAIEYDLVVGKGLIPATR